MNWLTNGSSRMLHAVTPLSRALKKSTATSHREEVPNWKQYEWLISKIFYDSNSSWTTTVLNDTSIVGEYSESSRQIDILVDDGNSKTIIECKHHARKIGDRPTIPKTLLPIPRNKWDSRLNDLVGLEFLLRKQPPSYRTPLY